MQHDHVLKKLNIDPIPRVGGGGGGGTACKMHLATFPDSLLFHWQHDLVPKN